MGPQGHGAHACTQRGKVGLFLDRVEETREEPGRLGSWDGVLIRIKGAEKVLEIGVERDRGKD